MQTGVCVPHLTSAGGCVVCRSESLTCLSFGKALPPCPGVAIVYPCTKLPPKGQNQTVWLFEVLTKLINSKLWFTNQNYFFLFHFSKDLKKYEFNKGCEISK